MIHSVVLGIPASLALLLGKVDVAHTQERGAQKIGHPLVAYVEDDVVMSGQAQELPRGIDRIEADQSFTKAGDGQDAMTNVVS